MYFPVFSMGFWSIIFRSDQEKLFVLQKCYILFFRKLYNATRIFKSNRNIKTCKIGKIKLWQRWDHVCTSSNLYSTSKEEIINFKDSTSQSAVIFNDFITAFSTREKLTSSVTFYYTSYHGFIPSFNTQAFRNVGPLWYCLELSLTGLNNVFVDLSRPLDYDAAKVCVKVFAKSFWICYI